MRVWIAITVAAAVVLSLATLIPAADVERIANGLPVYPDARLLESRTREHDDGSSSVYAAYRLPPRTTRAEVERFYRTRVHASWHRPDRRCEGFTRDGVLMMAAIDNSDDDLLNVLVVSDGAERCADYSWFLHS